ncbi:MAG: ABC transporter substrate-binding protein [Hyphomicrobiaceae bacterium]|jgi:ABC-type dipeptide transport system, periplasmic component|nr:MAG: peptide ABC transporter substrate-binding protein [Bacteroidota bacterium]
MGYSRGTSTKGFVTGLLVVPVSILAACFANASTLIEPPYFKEEVAQGRLLPVAERVPENPRVIDLKSMGRVSGQYGGRLRMLMGDPKDIRMMVVYGYSRLIGYDENLNFVPDILEDFAVEEGRIFTFRLRKEHRWSDGKPFTSEDFRYFWEDMANNPELFPTGPPTEMLVDGKPPHFEVLDKWTIRYTWHAPNPAFIPALAGALPLYIFAPSHYLKQFHPKYANPDDLKKKISAARVRSWSALHERKGRMYRPENPHLPSLEPWCNSTEPPSTRFVFKRNPFFHRIDTTGHQLPYIDEVVLNIGSNALVAAQAGSGEADLQARYIRFDDYTFLKNAEKRGRIKVYLWERGEGSRFAIYPNLNTQDPVWRKLFQDVRFRRALSLAINRREINQVIFYGLARESANTMLRQSPLYKPEYARAWSEFDIDLANRLLDEVGLGKKAGDGIRLLPDGRRAELIIETAGESTEQTDVLSLIRDTLLKVGIKIYARPTQRDLFRKRVYAGQTLMSVWGGFDNAIATADMRPHELAPTSQAQLQWPRWGQYFEEKGKVGEEPSLTEVRRLAELYEKWNSSDSRWEREAVWHEMLQIHADQVFTIGTVNSTQQPLVVSKDLVNVPEKGIWAFEPGGYFGRYMPDTFWFRSRGS